MKLLLGLAGGLLGMAGGVLVMVLALHAFSGGAEAQAKPGAGDAAASEQAAPDSAAEGNPATVRVAIPQAAVSG